MHIEAPRDSPIELGCHKTDNALADWPAAQNEKGHFFSTKKRADLALSR